MLCHLDDAKARETQLSAECDAAVSQLDTGSQTGRRPAERRDREPPRCRARHGHATSDRRELLGTAMLPIRVNCRVKCDAVRTANEQ
eukprot:4864378-Pyramimonas_sp.AAC.1